MAETKQTEVETNHVEAVKLYNELRAANPWLPEPEHVMREPFSLHVEQNRICFLELRLLITVPDHWWTTGPGTSDD